MQLAQGNILEERDVIFWMPVERVEDAVERHRIQHMINGVQNVFSTLPKTKLSVYNQRARKRDISRTYFSHAVPDTWQ